jgi:Tol biopolymer transport system component
MGVRELALLVAAVVLVGAVSAVVLLKGGDGAPAGRIGYHAGDIERWVNARGETVDAPVSWPPEHVGGSASAAPALGVQQTASPDGRAIAYVSITDEGAWSIWRLMVKEGDRVTELGQLAGGDGPPLVTGGGKSAARSVDGVPLVIAWSPDGTKLAWGSVTDAPFHLRIADRVTWASRSYPLEGGYVGELAWSADGRYLAVSTYAKDRADHTLLVMDTLENHGPKRLAKGCVVVWAPDSRHLVLHGEPRTQPGLLVISVDGDVRQVTERTDVAPFAWVGE